MNILQLKIDGSNARTPTFKVSDHETRREMSERANLRVTYLHLFAHREETLGHACDVADYWYKENFMKYVDKLHEDGWIDVKEDRIELRASPPGNALEWLARCAD